MGSRALIERSINEFKKDYEIPENFESRDQQLLFAARKAYGDITIRTVAGAGKATDLKEKSVEKIVQIMARFLEESVENRKEFEVIHKKMCGEFLDFLNGELQKANVKAQKYGKTQKVINMALKYLYSFDDIRDEKSEWFRYAHMPIDSYILAWYKSIRDKGYQDKLGNTPWSNLDKEIYYNIQAHISEKLEAGITYRINGEEIHLPANALEAEFIIWPQAKAVCNYRQLQAALRGVRNERATDTIFIPGLEKTRENIDELLKLEISFPKPV